MSFEIHAADVYKIFQYSRFDAYFDVEYFKTEANYGPSGDKQSLQAGYSFRDITTQTSARYVLLNNLGFYTGLNFSNVESSNVLNTRTKSVMTHIFAGADYQIWQADAWSLYTDLSYWHSNEKIELNQDEALASDGASEFKAQLVGLLKNNNFKSFTRIGYDYRSEGLSSLLLYGFGGEYLFGANALGVEFEGISSVKDDEQTDTPLNRETLTNQVNAGSKKYFAINPNLLEAGIYYSYAFDPNFILKLNAGSTVIGSNSAEGLYAGASLNWGFGGGRTHRTSRMKSIKEIENNSGLPDNDPAFKIETEDGVNQDLFKSSEPVKKK